MNLAIKRDAGRVVGPIKSLPSVIIFLWSERLDLYLVGVIKLNQLQQPKIPSIHSV